jgi:hypothetical protein
MGDKVIVGRPISIAEAGHDEHWLRDIICEDPSILGLGELQLLTKERVTSSGGILDLLLTDPEDRSMYEVELMLGETDESHIIRTIEYWDNQKRVYPQREHYAVIIAEEITSRFFNVIRLMSSSIPMIAIKVSLIKVGEQEVLNFTTILDIYEEPEEAITEESLKDENYWKQYSDWTLETAKIFYHQLLPLLPKSKLNYVKNYISIYDGTNIYFLNKRARDKTSLAIHIKSNARSKIVDIIKAKLDSNNISYSYYNKYGDFYVTVDKEMIVKYKELFNEITKILIESKIRKVVNED